MAIATATRVASTAAINKVVSRVATLLAESSDIVVRTPPWSEHVVVDVVRQPTMGFLMRSPAYHRAEIASNVLLDSIGGVQMQFAAREINGPYISVRMPGSFGAPVIDGFEAGAFISRLPGVNHVARVARPGGRRELVIHVDDRAAFGNLSSMLRREIADMPVRYRIEKAWSLA